MQKELLANGTAVFVSKNNRFGSDGILLSSFANIKQKDAVCELCSGCGIISLRLYDNGHRGKCVAVEISPLAFELLQKGVAENKCDNIIPVCADLKDFKSAYLFDSVICNPPYFNSGFESPQPERKLARHEQACSLSDVCTKASALLKDGGKLYMCHRPERLADVICEMRSANIEPKILRFVYQREGEDAPWLLLIEGQKNRGTGLIIRPALIIENIKGVFCDEMLTIFSKTQ